MTKNVSAATPAKSKWLGWKVLALLSGHRRTIVALSLLVCVTAALDVAVPFLTRQVIDGVVRSLQSAKADSLRSLLLAAGSILAITLTTRLLRTVYNYRLFRVVSEAEDEVKNEA